LNSSEGIWSEITLEGHPCEIYEPPQRNLHGYVLIYLHGVHLDRLSDKTAFIHQFDKYGLPVVVPITQRSWWTNTICDEFDANITAEQHLLENVLPMVQQRFDTAAPRIGLLGTSMGGQGALRISYKYPDTFPVVAAISPAIDFHTRYYEGDETIPQMFADPEAARQETATLYARPLYWPRHQFFCCDPTDTRWWESSDRLHMKLYSMGIPHEHDLESVGGGHGFEYYNVMAQRAVTFLFERLEQERLRVV